MPVDHTVRDARVEDLPAITIIRTSVRENHLSVADLAERGITEQSTAKRMLRGDLGAWVTTNANEITAFAMADKTTGNIFALFTHPDHEGKGYGTALMQRCEEWLAQHGVKRAHLDTDRTCKAVGFYKKRGWTEFDRDEHEVWLEKFL